MKTKKVDCYKLFNLVKDGKKKILYPDKTKFNAVIDKDLESIDSKIEKINNKHVSKIKESDIALVKDLMIVSDELKLIRKYFDIICGEIKENWTNPFTVTIPQGKSDYESEVELDEHRLAHIIYEIDLTDKIFEQEFSKYEFFAFIKKGMRNTINYLSKFGCITCPTNDECESWNNHPWYKGIVQ